MNRYGARLRIDPDPNTLNTSVPPVPGTESLLGTHIALRTLSADMFETGLTPIEIVSSLPTLPSASYPQGSVVFLTTDNKLYRSTGTTWTSAVPTADLTGTINTGQIANDAVTAAKLAALSIDLGKLTTQLVNGLSFVDARNRVFNASFEDDMAYWQSPVAGVSVVTNSTLAKSGNKYMEITASVVTDCNMSMDNQSSTRYYDIPPGAVIKFGGWAMVASGTTTGAIINCVTADKDKANRVGHTAIVTAGAWTFVSGEFTPSATDKYVGLKVTLGTPTGSATVRFDDLFVVIETPGSDIIAHSITATQIAAATITANEIAALTILAGNIAAGAITTSKISAGAVTANEIAAATITGSKIAAGTITASNIQALTITANELAADSVTTNKIQAGAVTAAKIAVTQLDAISANLGVITAGLARDTNNKFTVDFTNALLTVVDNQGAPVTRIKLGKVGAATTDYGLQIWNSAGTLLYDLTGLASNTVGTPQIIDGNITTVKIGDSQVTTQKVADSNITTAKIGDLQVTTQKMADGSVTTVKIGDLQVTSGKIVDNAVITAKINDTAISTAKLAADAVTFDKIAANSISVKQIFVGSLDNLAINPGFEQSASLSTPWGIAKQGGGTWSVVSTNVRSGANAYQYDPSGQTVLAQSWANGARVVNEQFAAAEGDQFYFEAYARKVGAGTANRAAVMVHYRSATNTDLGGTQSSFLTLTTSYQKMSVSATAPANTAYVEFILRVAFDGNAELINFDDAYARRMVTGDIVVDGTITAVEIAANTITANEIAANAITSSELAAGAVVAGKIAAGTIVAADIAAATITADRLNITTLSSITADVGTLNAGKIQNAGATAGILLSGSLPGSWTTYLNLVATGTNALLHHNKLDLKADGSAVFSGAININDVITTGVTGTSEQFLTNITPTAAGITWTVMLLDAGIANSASGSIGTLTILDIGAGNINDDVVTRQAIHVKTPVIDVSGTISTLYGIKIENQSGATTNYAIHTGTGKVSINDTLEFRVAASKIVPGSTSLTFRNNADGSDNLVIADAGNVTLSRGSLIFGTAAGKVIPGATSLTFRNNADSNDNLALADGGNVTVSRGNLVFGAAASKIIPGATSITLRNNADSQNNLVVTDAGDVTISRGKLFIGSSTSTLVPGATSFVVRNTADTQTNLTVADGGNITGRGTVFAGAGGLGITGATSLGGTSTGTGTVKMNDTTSRNSVGFIEVVISGTSYYIPIWDAIGPF